MLKRLQFLKRLFRDLPRQLKLSYCLAFDDRVPALNKLAVLAALALIVTPFLNLPEWIPVVGEMDVLALTLLTTRMFVSTAPRDVVQEQERLLKERRSRFDDDVSRGERLAVALARRFGRERQSEMEFVGATQSRPAPQDVSGVQQA